MSTTQVNTDPSTTTVSRPPTMRRTVTSATSYEVQVDDGFAARAEQLLAPMLAH